MSGDYCDSSFKSEKSKVEHNLPAIDVDEVCKKLRLLFIRVFSLHRDEKIIAVKIYLAYILHAQNIDITTISELQVLTYKIGKAIYCEEDAAEITGVDLSKKLIERGEPDLAARSRPNTVRKSRIKTPHRNRNILVKKILSLKGAPLSSNLSDPDLEQAYFEHVNAYLAHSDQTIQFAAHIIVGKLLSVIDENCRPTTHCSFMDRILGCFSRSQAISVDEKFRLITQYHKKGLFAYDCKRIYMREMLRKMGNENSA